MEDALTQTQRFRAALHDLRNVIGRGDPPTMKDLEDQGIASSASALSSAATQYTSTTRHRSDSFTNSTVSFRFLPCCFIVFTLVTRDRDPHGGVKPNTVAQPPSPRHLWPNPTVLPPVHSGNVPWQW